MQSHDRTKIQSLAKSLLRKTRTRAMDGKAKVLPWLRYRRNPNLSLAGDLATTERSRGFFLPNFDSNQGAKQKQKPPQNASTGKRVRNLPYCTVVRARTHCGKFLLPFEMSYNKEYEAFSPSFSYFSFEWEQNCILKTLCVVFFFKENGILAFQCTLYNRLI